MGTPGGEPLVLAHDGEGRNEVSADWVGWDPAAVFPKEAEKRTLL